VRGARPFASLERLVGEALSPAAGEVVVLACSGGPDSIALAGLLAAATRAAGASIVLAHVNHGVRAGAWQDEALVLAAGARLGARVVTAGLAPGPAGEARLREERYAALERFARQAGARRVCTAHHAEDQTETILLALFRGAGPAGLGGMEPVRPLGPGIDLVRPLLGVEPAVLRAYCAAAGLPFALDPSNADTTYRRNALRAALGDLRAGFPHLDAAVARCAAILRDERAATPRARLRAQLRAELAAAGDVSDLTFERLDGAARALERGQAGRHFLRRGLELVVR
jgi:tRNA(Ile)-lysidine synthase